MKKQTKTYCYDFRMEGALAVSIQEIGLLKMGGLVVGVVCGLWLVAEPSENKRESYIVR